MSIRVWLMVIDKNESFGPVIPVLNLNTRHTDVQDRKSEIWNSWKICRHIHFPGWILEMSSERPGIGPRCTGWFLKSKIGLIIFLATIFPQTSYCWYPVNFVVYTPADIFVSTIVIIWYPPRCKIFAMELISSKDPKPERLGFT